MTEIIPKKWKSKKAKWLSEEVLQIAEERREEKSKGERERHAQMGVSLVAQMVKDLPGVQETQDRSLGLEDPLGKGRATHCRATVQGS